MNSDYRYKFSILLVACFSVIGTAQSYEYNDVASDVGINHTYFLNNSGGGSSFHDFDMDGKDDITLATGEGELIHFYRNTGNDFERVDLGIDNVAQAKSVIWVDYDNDGDKDFYVAEFDGYNKLYNNDGQMNFSDETINSGLPIDSVRSFGAIWGDYNRDGHLDLYYTARNSGVSATGHMNRLFKNNGDGTFVEKTYYSSADDTGRLPFCAAFFDYNKDNWPDIYIANDRNKRNTLLKNNTGKYEDVSEACNANLEIDAMNVAIADIDNNGLQDIYVTNTAAGSALLTCSTDSNEFIFEEEAGERGVGFYGIGWGANFLDANNDGWQDLYVSGMLIGSDVISSELYINDKSGLFDVETDGFVGDTVRSFTNAIGDWNNDGVADIIVNNSELFKSQLWSSSGGEKNWIKIGLQGVISNRDAIGTTVELFYENEYQFHYTHCGIGFMGQNSSNLLVGLGDISQIDSIKLLWPTGHIDIITDIPTNQKITIIEGQSTDGNINVDPLILTSNNNIEQASGFSIYPNPAYDQISIEGFEKDITWKTYDINGIEIDNGRSLSINIEQYKTGIYILSVKNEVGKTQTKLFQKL